MQRLVYLGNFATTQKILCGALAIIILTLGAIGLFGALRRLPATVPNDFHMYYVEGWVVNHAMPLYEEDYMAVAAGKVGVASIGYGYPPFFAALMRPVAVLPLAVASNLWLITNLACLFLSVWLLTRFFRAPHKLFFLLCAVALLLPGVYDTLLLGQINLVLTLLFVCVMTLGARAKNSRAQIAAGILLGAAIAIKVYPLALLVVFVLYRRHLALAVTALTIAATFGIGILYGGGWNATFRYWTVIVPSQSVLFMNPADQAAQAVFARLFQITYLSVALSPGEILYATLSPWWNDPALGRIVLYGFSGLVIVVTAFALWKIKRALPDTAGMTLSCGLILTALLLVQPHVWDHYLAHLIIPLALLILYARAWIQKAAMLALIESALLLLVLQHYWGWLLRVVQSPLLMLFGFAGTFVLWVALIIFFERYFPASETTSFTFSRR